MKYQHISETLADRESLRLFLRAIIYIYKCLLLKMMLISVNLLGFLL